MDGIGNLIRVAGAYGAALQLERSTVSWRIFGDGKKLDALVAGADIQVRRFETAMSWLSTNWPDEAEWPSDVSRPLNSHAAPPSDVPTLASERACGAGKNDGNVSRTGAGA